MHRDLKPGNVLVTKRSLKVARKSTKRAKVKAPSAKQQCQQDEKEGRRVAKRQGSDAGEVCG
jgi:hypothetical protein